MRPSFHTRQMAGQNYSYTARIEALVNTGNTTGFPVSMDGFANGTLCEPQYGELCKSGSCQDFACAAKVANLCVKASCEAGNDCESGVCIWDACATGEGQVEGGCPCSVNSDCKSGDCDTKLTSLDWVCEFGSAGEHAICMKSILVLAVLLALSSV